MENGRAHWIHVAGITIYVMFLFLGWIICRSGDKCKPRQICGVSAAGYPLDWHWDPRHLQVRRTRTTATVLTEAGL